MTDRLQTSADPAEQPTAARANTDVVWTAYEAAAATGGALCSRGGDESRWLAEEWRAAGISIDTRTLQPGDLFVALEDVRDGHDFILSAFERGAAAALISKMPAESPNGAALLLTGDTLEGLTDLARAARMRNFGKRVAITGSAGKTSTKELLRHVLAGAGQVHAAEKSLNNHFGVPLTLARMPASTDYGVFEIGMNHAGEITPLTKLVKPHVAIVTTVAAAHLEFFDSVEQIAEAKAEIFLGVNKGGAAFLPADNPHFPILRRRAEEAGVARIFTFGESDDADVRLVSYASDGVGGDIAASVFGADISFRLGAPGKHQAMNAMAVLGAAVVCGTPAAEAAARMASFGAASGRGAQAEIDLGDGRRITLLDESYNANPTSMAAAMSILGDLAPRGEGRRIAVLGDMLELGARAEELHASLADPLLAANVDRVYASGALMQALWARLPETARAAIAEDADALVAPLVDGLKDGDVVMVKGSNASKVSKIVGALHAAATKEN